MGAVARFVYKDPERMLFMTKTDEPRYEAIIEGICPTDGAQLERRSDSDVAWCPTCKLGWGLRSTGPGESTLTLGLSADTTKLDAAFDRLRDLTD